MVKTGTGLNQNSESLVLSSQSKGIGWITLNRPKALNALNLDMVRLIQNVLDEWRDDDKVRLIILKSNSEKAFCAGGDLKSVHAANYAGDSQHLDELFREEYMLDNAIYSYPKPYISFIDGIIMGGGMGLAINGAFRITSQRSTFAMPETKIGYFPDVGATYFLNQCPGQLGLYIGLTGITFSANDALFAGIATHYIPKEHWEGIEQKLENAELHHAEDIKTILNQHSECFDEKSEFEQYFGIINECFSGASVEEIFESLEKHPTEFARNTLEQLKQRCPISLKTTFQQLQIGEKLLFPEAMKFEFRQSRSFVNSPDFIEGIRAAVIDKDRKPQWSVPTIYDVSDEKISAILERDDFEPLKTYRL